MGAGCHWVLARVRGTACKQAVEHCHVFNRGVMGRLCHKKAESGESRAESRKELSAEPEGAKGLRRKELGVLGRCELRRVQEAG
jgi:hypothetical protein